MRQFTVPQFIDNEDKIMGPITTRQFLIMMVCAMVIGAWKMIFHFTTFIILSIGTFGVFAILAFVKINEMPFHYFMLNVFQTIKKPGKRVWNNAFGKNDVFTENEVKHHNEKVDDTEKTERRYTKSRLNELSLMVDTQGGFQGRKSGNTNIKQV